VPGNNGQADMWVVKLDGNGATQWSRNYGGSGSEGASQAIQISTGGFLVSGAGRSSDQTFTDCNPYIPLNNTAFFIKLDEQGEVEWVKCYGGNGTDAINRIMEAPDGTFWAAGTTYSTDGVVTNHHGEINAWILHLAPDGSLIDNSVFGGSANDHFTDFTFMAEGQLLLAGYTHSTDGDILNNHGSSDIWLMMMNPDMQLILIQNYGGSGHDLSPSVTYTSNGEAIFGASSTSLDMDVYSNHGDLDVWVVKFLPFSLGVGETFFGTELLIYPNPVADILNVRLEGSAAALLEIFDAVGRSVQRTTVHASPMVVPVEELTPGMYTVTLSAKAGDVVGYGRFIKR
jgi:hypothetical protein